MKISSCFKQQKKENLSLTLIDGMPAILFAIGCVDHFGFCIIILFTVYHIVIKSMHTKVYSIPTTTTTDRAYVCNITP